MKVKKMKTNELIKIYNQIKNIKYKIVDIDYSLESSYDLINSNGASCTPKHIILSDKFNQLGFQSRFCIYEFNWSDLNFEYPNRLSKLLKIFSSDFHTNLEVKIRDRWVMVDATWDNELIDAGMTGTKEWNGKDSTLNAVKPIKTYKFNSIREKNDFLKTEANETIEFIEKKVEFINELNNFFNHLRLKN